jgi:hypothetical protein
LLPHSTDNASIKDERWAIKTFRPILRLLHVQNIPDPPDFTIVYLADERNLVIQGMGRCVLIIERENLPHDTGGILITTYDKNLDYFKLHILINNRLCARDIFETRCHCKITTVHEFTHAVASLSAICRVRSDELVKRLQRNISEKNPCHIFCGYYGAC